VKRKKIEVRLGLLEQRDASIDKLGKDAAHCPHVHSLRRRRRVRTAKHISHTKHELLGRTVHEPLLNGGVYLRHFNLPGGEWTPSGHLLRPKLGPAILLGATAH
jgi:hypothetical protein